MRNGWFALLAAAVMSVGVHAQGLSVKTPAGQVVVGSEVAVGVTASGMVDGGAPSIGVFDFDLAFDPLLLEVVSVRFGGGLDVLGLGAIDSVLIGPGTVNLLQLSLDTVEDLHALQPDEFSLATITFAALAEGASALELSVNAIGDAFGVAIPVSIANGEVAVVAVPEPASLAMMAGGLALIAGAARRRSRLVSKRLGRSAA